MAKNRALTPPINNESKCDALLPTQDDKPLYHIINMPQKPSSFHSYHKLNSQLEPELNSNLSQNTQSAEMEEIQSTPPHNTDGPISTTNAFNTPLPSSNIMNGGEYCSDDSIAMNSDAPHRLIRFRNELLIDHSQMTPVRIAVIGDSHNYIHRLCHSIRLGYAPSDDELEYLRSMPMRSERIMCPYRTRLLPIELTSLSFHTKLSCGISNSPYCWECSSSTMFDTSQLNNIQVFIIIIDPDTPDCYSRVFGHWYPTIKNHYPNASVIGACVRNVTSMGDDTPPIPSQSDLKIKYTALLDTVSVCELFERAVSAALDEEFCETMKRKYEAYCVRNVKNHKWIWRSIDTISPYIWVVTVMYNLAAIYQMLAAHRYVLGCLLIANWIIVNILLSYQFIKIYWRNANTLILIKGCAIGMSVGFVIPIFAWWYQHFTIIREMISARRYPLLNRLATDMDESSLSDFTANIPTKVRRSCWGFAVQSITLSLPFTFLILLTIIIYHDQSFYLISTLLLNIVWLLLNGYCLVFTRTDRYAFQFGWICVGLDIVCGTLSIFLTFFIAIDQYNSTVLNILHTSQYIRMLICGILALGFEFLNIAESWEHITAGFFEILNSRFWEHITPVPRLRCVGAVFAIIFLSLGGIIIFGIFQSLGMIIFLFALYFLNWSWCLSLLDDSAMHTFDELYSSLIHFILEARNKVDYGLRLSVVNFELNPFTKKIKNIDYNLVDLVHLKPSDWLRHGKKYFTEHFLWGAIGGYHYHLEKWNSLRLSDDSSEESGYKQLCPQFFWLVFFWFAAYVFQPLYTLIIVFSNVYPILTYIALMCTSPHTVPMFIHILMALYLTLLPLFCITLPNAYHFAYTLFHIVSARPKLYKRPRQPFEEQDSMKFFARVWKHYIYVHCTSLRDAYIEEYFGDMYQEVLSLLSPLQRMDNLIQLYETMYTQQCGKVNIQFSEYVDLEKKHASKSNLSNRSVTAQTTAAAAFVAGNIGGSAAIPTATAVGSHSIAGGVGLLDESDMKIAPIETVTANLLSTHQSTPPNQSNTTSPVHPTFIHAGSSSASPTNYHESHSSNSRLNRRRHRPKTASDTRRQMSSHFHGKRRVRRANSPLLLDRSLIDLMTHNAAMSGNSGGGNEGSTAHNSKARRSSFEMIQRSTAVNNNNNNSNSSGSGIGIGIGIGIGGDGSGSESGSLGNSAAVMSAMKHELRRVESDSASIGNNDSELDMNEGNLFLTNNNSFGDINSLAECSIGEDSNGNTNKQETLTDTDTGMGVDASSSMNDHFAYPTYQPMSPKRVDTDETDIHTFF